MNAAPPRLFASTELAARLERAETSLIAESASAATARDPQGRHFSLPLAGGVAAWAGEGSPLNKVVGLGFDGALDETALAGIEAAFAERGSPVQVELSTAADPAVAAALTRRGYVLSGFENVLALRLEAGRSARIAPGVSVRESAAEEFDEWIDIVVRGFAAPDLQGVAAHEEFPRDVIERAMRDCIAASGFVLTTALRDGVPAGGGSLRQCDRVAQLCGAATLPAHRRHGVQSSLLEARLAAAAKAGCDIAVVTTQPGSKSQQNVQKLGFELMYSRAVLVRAFEV
ncbi:MAG: GNAT family N-acetyltransferase [Thermoanaerobaculia bacterium]